MNNKSIIIAGSGRSGTTWVQDSLAEANGLRTVFEPLHPVGVPVSRQFSYQYISAETDSPELKQFMDQVLSGRYRSLWMNYRIRPDRFNLFHVGLSKAVFNLRKFVQHYKKYRVKKNSRLAIKFIRANLMLPWLARQYELPMLFVTRHPCAVIASRLKLGGKDWASQQVLDPYRSSPGVVKLIRDEFGVDITESFSTVEALACHWCIENILPIQWAKDARYVVTAYERLLCQPEHEWKRVILGLGLTHAPNRSIREAPSQQVSTQMQGSTFTESHLGSWRQVLKEDQVKEVSLMLERFSYSGYSVASDLPVDL